MDETRVGRMAEQQGPPTSSDGVQSTPKIVPEYAQRVADAAARAGTLILERLVAKKAPEGAMIGAAVVAVFRPTSSVNEAVALVLSCASGTKCLPVSNLHGMGSQVRDGHAETLARRGAVRVLMEMLKSMTQCPSLDEDCNAQQVFAEAQEKMMLDGASSEKSRRRDWFGLKDYRRVAEVCFVKATESEGYPLWRWNSEIELVLWMSHAPCGDASIFPQKRLVPKTEVVDCQAKSKGKGKRLAEGEMEGSGGRGKKARVSESGVASLPLSSSSSSSSSPSVLNEEKEGIRLNGDDEMDDVHRSGGRVLKEDGTVGEHEWTLTSVVRSKPGRGPPTASASCSDKVARWIALGMQGSLLAPVFGTVRFTGLAVSDSFDQGALDRALIDRLDGMEGLSGHDELPWIAEVTHGQLGGSPWKFGRLMMAASPAPQDVGKVKFEAVSRVLRLGSPEPAGEKITATVGRRQGVGAKQMLKASAWAQWSEVSSAVLYSVFMEGIAGLEDEGLKSLSTKPIPDAVTTKERARRLIPGYDTLRTAFYSLPSFRTWPQTPAQLKSFPHTECKPKN